VTLLGGLHEFVVKFYGPVGSKCSLLSVTSVVSVIVWPV